MAWKPRALWRSALVVTTLCCLPAARTAQATPMVTQSVQLQPGWNAVYLEVSPQAASPASVFAALPGNLKLDSAWMWDSGSPVQFLQDASDGLANQAGWRVYYPAGRPESVTTNLFAIVGQQAYLLKLSGTTGGTWKVPGRPALRVVQWTADSFNLRGFGVDPVAPPSFEAYFAPSPAHAGQDVYQLGTDGTWQRIADLHGTKIQSGQAYYVYSKGGSSYAGPLQLELEQGDGLDFGSEQNAFQIRVRNLHSAAATVSLGLLQPPAKTPLAYRRMSTVADPNSAGNTVTSITWPDLPATLLQPAASGQDVYISLAVKRNVITASPFESVLQIGDGQGTRQLLPVVARLGAASRSARACTLPPGLWVGTATLDAVNEAQKDPNLPGFSTATAAPANASVRLLLHVDGSCQARLLKSVVMLWQDGVLVPDPNHPGSQILGTPGHYVLLTDDTLIPNFGGAGLRDGDPVGFRVSAISYDFDEPAAGGSHVKNTLEMTGNFALGQTLVAALRMSPNNPTNPFLHRFHPDHDNLDAYGAPLDANNPRVLEAPGFTRNLRLTIDSNDPLDPNGPGRFDWINARLEGTYQDTIVGVHKHNVIVAGTFSLQHASSIDVLNQ